jgi:uncharacterized membrane protein
VDIRDFLSDEEKQWVVAAIEEAERNTSGEIRVHIENFLGSRDVYKEAVRTFNKLGMQKTAERNGVLIFVAVHDHKFAIIGDQGINEKVPGHFWEDTRNLMLEHFKKGEYAKGISEGVLHAGEQLKAHFPFHSEDKNELSDEISFG